jgi:hypothetical protein
MRTARGLRDRIWPAVARAEGGVAGERILDALQAATAQATTMLGDGRRRSGFGLGGRGAPRHDFW